MLGVPPSPVEASASDTTAIIEVLEEDAGPRRWRCSSRSIASKWARAAAPAARRLLDAGVEPSSAPLELQVIKSFSGELGILGVLGVHVQAGAAHFVATLIAQRTDDGSAHLDGGLAAALDEDQVEERFAAFRDTLEAAVDLPDPAVARKDAARFFAWARELPAPTTAGLELERPLLAPALAPARSVAATRRGDERRVAADASAGLRAFSSRTRRDRAGAARFPPDRRSDGP